MKFDYDKLLNNIEYENSIPDYDELPDYIKNYFCRSLNYFVKKWVEEREEREQENNTKS